MTQQRRPRPPQSQRAEVVQLPTDHEPEPVATSPEPTPTGPVFRVSTGVLRALLHLHPTVSITGARFENGMVVLDVDSPEAPDGATELEVRYVQFAGRVSASPRWIAPDQVA